MTGEPFLYRALEKHLFPWCHAEEHCSSGSLWFCKLSLVFKVMAAESHALSVKSPSVCQKWEKVIICCCRLLFPSSNLRMSLQFHFLHSSHARSIVPWVLLWTQWLHRGGFWKSKKGFVLKPHKGHCHVWESTSNYSEPEVEPYDSYK